MKAQDRCAALRLIDRRQAEAGLAELLILLCRGPSLSNEAAARCDLVAKGLADLRRSHNTAAGEN